ncbi:uncharacterized protein LOC107813606 [Nicotiana tabacum]|uniref:Uncharacterized protein LOC107813606 n=2 Tax=Nicotiana TaxID=4085 RepID=A0A1S4BZX1_TOBAC|nr:PREDICTED: uncharacterized protein LOC104249190 [Nicotiana sylvestris]XP_016494378.1 PREDICTED: uncharacterized protein LOC107813606 [Nicotiana tabacum]
MASFSGLGIGLSFVFGCILMGLVAELYYLLWVKKRIPKSESEDEYSSSSSYGTELFHLFCWKKPNSVSNISSQELNNTLRNQEMNGQDQDLELGNSKDLLLKGYGEDSVESELMRLHNLCGPPRFLFTIKEETKEDLESEDGKSRGERSRTCSRTRSLSDLILTPLSSPPIKGHNLDSYNCQGFNPLFESSTETELNRLRSSPPPKFKFLRDAEEKLIRKLIEEAEKRGLKNEISFQDSAIKKPFANEEKQRQQQVGSGEGNVYANLIPTPRDREVVSRRPSAQEGDKRLANEEKGSFISFLGKSKLREPLQQLQVQNSTSVKVIPLASSPSTYKPVDNESVMV